MASSTVPTETSEFCCTYSVTSMSCATADLSHCKGKLNDQSVIILFDLRAKGVFVIHSHVRLVQVTGKHIFMHLPEGSPMS